MKINKIEIVNFRNHNNCILTPLPNLTIITGNNGVGKTSLLESIYYCGFGRSFRDRNELNLIKHDYNEFVIRCFIEDKDSKIHKMLVYVSKKERKFYVDDVLIKKISELNKYINILLFEPRMIDLFKSSSHQKRKDYLDLVLSKQSERYLKDLRDYKKLLANRNELLKQEIINKVLLQTYTKQMVDISYRIDVVRSIFFKKINTVLNDISREISNNNKRLEISYSSIVNIDDSYKKNLLKLYKDSSIEDIKSKTTNIGIHKEDYILNIDDKNIGLYGSQGENRLGVISFVLAPYFILKNDIEKPIILLDDVLSELDYLNQERLVNFVKRLNQVFITATNTMFKEYEYQIKGESKDE